MLSLMNWYESLDHSAMKLSKMLISSLLMAFLLLVPENASASTKPSWCSSSVLNFTEKTICDTPLLHQFDQELNSLFAKTQHRVSRTEQDRWLQKRNRCVSNINCIRNAYETRIAELEIVLTKIGSRHGSSGEVVQSFADRTTFGYLNSSRKSWNAYFQANGRVTYWHSWNEIRHGRWRVLGRYVCVDLGSGEDCRTPVFRNDGMLDWIDPDTGRPTSTIVRLETGDVLGLKSLPHGASYAPSKPALNQVGYLPAGSQWLQTHSTRELFLAEQHALNLRNKGFTYAIVASSRNGWHAVLAGSLRKTESGLVERWKRSGLVPSDAYLTQGAQYFKFHSPNKQWATPQRLTSQARKQCTPDEYNEAINACRVVFASELACNKVLSGEGADLNPRSSQASVICSLAAQTLIARDIDLTATGLSFIAGVLDDASEDAFAEGTLSGQAWGVVFQSFSLLGIVGGYRYCTAAVENKCGY